MKSERKKRRKEREEREEKERNEKENSLFASGDEAIQQDWNELVQSRYSISLSVALQDHIFECIYD